MNPISDVLNRLTMDLGSLSGAVAVSRDPAVIGPQVAKAGLAVLVSPAYAEERSSFNTWFLSVPVNILFPGSPEPRYVDAAYGLAYEFMNSDAAEALGMELQTVTIDAATALPAITVTFRISTDC